MIGEGGFGKVYLGLISEKKIPVAVKELHIEPLDEFASKAEELEKFQEFQREVYIMSCLSHENLVRLYGIMLKVRGGVWLCVCVRVLFLFF
jgi:serine/threonine protein kinase